jgi:hypothetical protein
MGTMKKIEILTSDLYYRFESANSGDVKLRCHSFMSSDTLLVVPGF